MIIETPPEIDAMPDGLPDKARQAFLLSQLDRLRHAGIAEPLGVSPRMLKNYMLCATTDCLRIARPPLPIHCPRQRHDSSRSLLARNRERSSMLLRVEECHPGRYASIKPVVPQAGYFFCKGHFLQGCGFLQHFLLLLMNGSYL